MQRASPSWLSFAFVASLMLLTTACGGPVEETSSMQEAGALAEQSECLTTASCTCTGGFDKNYNAIDPATTYCGMTVCGYTYRIYECTTAGWTDTGQNCATCSDGVQNQGEAGVDCGGPCATSCPCRCYNGTYQGGQPIDPATTYCGMTVCGTTNSYYECRSNGWTSVGGSC